MIVLVVKYGSKVWPFIVPFGCKLPEWNHANHPSILFRLSGAESLIRGRVAVAAG